MKPTERKRTRRVEPPPENYRNHRVVNGRCVYCTGQGLMLTQQDCTHPGAPVASSGRIATSTAPPRLGYE